ncbi:FxsA family protein [Sulfurimonas aquatica]|uniref:FxsA family protein n=1 Tax=Sulfurimonas aquatica TaxID=2672570 RepID=A0A975B0V9_9BACT|nr:FxsA family protein [Sulfurimonas aquatica]QSZ42075.1 FxsA family protein [Sulfurimonas aquatica]
MIYFLVYFFLEVVISVEISSYLGGVLTFAEILLSAFIGISILINFRKTLVENMTAVSYNCIDLEQFQRLNLFTLFGAILLIVPGFLTDILGLLMQLSTFTSLIVNRYNVKSGKCNSSYKEQYNIKKDSDVIDVEIISDNPSIK